MRTSKVSIVLMTHDRTRKARVTVPRSMNVEDLVKASTKRWFLSVGMTHQVSNTTTGKILHLNQHLSDEIVSDGDILMIQPLAVHGGV